MERIVSNVFSNKILEKTLEDFDELWGVAIQEDELILLGIIIRLMFQYTFDIIYLAGSPI